ncbi:ZYBA0S04-07536g1_1 [Zygosaccharomyces bailii CLIB 213]|uniref:N-acetylglucosaminylphosphatidylinositol deacetylase n=1 Tax=Zygosaccharomyces bailii (strain CLIB 213 / ATCC 58445 / CBS 680 / BCRC 21525 / NBRC 1098 / NCYC 1416 / NRRL Y-2227) TaxID=1333698 RepID=A0A8J2WZV7_ZYGB2|nr:ZYBA0S04-07536g1_1 [Zygosaccharomyces bailii CLIB 213]
MKITKVYFLLWLIFLGFSSRIKLRNSTVYHNELNFLNDTNSLSLIVGHPDDEVMFFAPTLLQLDKFMPSSVDFNVVCLSKGGADGLSETRVIELQRSVNFLLANTKRKVELFQFDYPDGHDERWDQTSVKNAIKSAVLENSDVQRAVLLTYDSHGVSNHPNHIACYNAVSALLHDEKNVDAALYLNSYQGNMALKYSSFFWELCKLTRQWLASHVSASPPALASVLALNPTVTLMSTYTQYILSFASMMGAHESQMVWYRYAWWTFSRFVFVNDLKVHFSN